MINKVTSPEDFFDLMQEIPYIISHATHAEFTEIGQILSDLRGIYITQTCKFLR